MNLCLILRYCRASGAGAMLALWFNLLPFCHPLFYLFLPFICWLCGVGVFELIVSSLSNCLAKPTSFNNNLFQLLQLIN